MGVEPPATWGGRLLPKAGVGIDVAESDARVEDEGSDTLRPAWGGGMRREGPDTDSSSAESSESLNEGDGDGKFPSMLAIVLRGVQVDEQLMQSIRSQA
jgi:hypothetical protein